MNIELLEIPGVIKESLTTFNDIILDGYSEKGQNGYVFFGLHNILKQRVAIKYYYYGNDTHHEVELLSGVNHPNVLQILGARSVEDGWAYFTTKEITGGDLDNYIESQNISICSAIDIIRGILQGLSVLHNEPNRILHRDLKPANILVDLSGKPIIADFGSIKRLPDDNNFIPGSQHSPLYRPPESWSEGKYFIVSDIYQVGLVLYQLLGGYFSYDGMEYLSEREIKKFSTLQDDFDRSKFIDRILAKKTQRATLIDLSSLAYYIPVQVKKIISKATSPDISKRYNSTSEFLLALHNLGQIPNWVIIDGIIHLLNWNSLDFRIVQRKDMFICEKKRIDGDIWRKDGSINEGSTDNAVLNELMERVL
jgi:eukaryotic-like serine/threonine-protein kinase